MEVNKTFDIRVRCTNKQLLDYIKSALTYGSEIIPGLEFVSFVEPVSLFEEKPIAQKIDVIERAPSKKEIAKLKESIKEELTVELKEDILKEIREKTKEKPKTTKTKK